MKDIIIIEAHRNGYGIDQLCSTMTAGELIEWLSNYDENTPVYIGNDQQSYGWYTYGEIDENYLYDRYRIAGEFPEFFDEEDDEDE